VTITPPLQTGGVPSHGDGRSVYLPAEAYFSLQSTTCLRSRANNIYFNPLNFSWNLGKGLYVAAGLGFVARPEAPMRVSLVPDYWTVRPHAAVSYLAKDGNLTVSALYDITPLRRAGQVCTGDRAQPATAPAFADFSPARRIGVGEHERQLPLMSIGLRPRNSQLGGRSGRFFKFQTTGRFPGGINPATGFSMDCAQLTTARFPTCGKDVNIGAGL